MKKAFLFCLVSLLTGAAVMAQSVKQVNWSYTTKKIADKTYEVHMTASIGGGWHLYAQDPGGDGPIATKFTFVKNPLASVTGQVKEVGNVVKKYESAWSHDVRYFEKEVDFVQVVKVKSAAKTNLSGKVEFMVCNDHECLPPAEVEFKVNIGG